MGTTGFSKKELVLMATGQSLDSNAILRGPVELKTDESIGDHQCMKSNETPVTKKLNQIKI